MPRLEPLAAETAPLAARETLRAPLVLNSSRIYAYWPPLLQGAAAMQTALDTGRALPEDLLRLSKLRAAQLIGCPF